MKKNKFKVGDTVIGNDLADERYNHTKKGWQGRVIEIKTNSFRAVDIGEDDTGSFALEYKYFDLLKSTEEVNNYEIF